MGTQTGKSKHSAVLLLEQWKNCTTEEKRIVEKAAARYYATLSDEELLEFIRHCAAHLGHPPIRAEVPGFRILKERFGPWPRMLERAGLKEVSQVYLHRKAARYEKRLKRHTAGKKIAGKHPAPQNPQDRE